MTAQEALKKNEKAQGLKAWQVDDTWFYVESEDGKIAYKCYISDHGDYCSCGDFATRGKNDPQFKCKHILAVMNSIPKNETLEAQFLEKRKPKLDERFERFEFSKIWLGFHFLPDFSKNRDAVEDITGRC
jgi:predicted nucleic acid-binding Zn finger protein